MLSQEKVQEVVPSLCYKNYGLFDASMYFVQFGTENYDAKVVVMSIYVPTLLSSIYKEL